MNYKIINLLSVIIGTEALTVMAGWIFRVDGLTRILPNVINMKFPTALLFFASAVGLYFMSRIVRDNSGISYVVLPGIALFIFLTGSALLGGALFNANTGFESFFTRQGASLLAEGSGWPSISTLIFFVLFGAVSILSLFPGKRTVFAIGLLGYIFAIGGLSAFAGYVFQIPALYYQFTAEAVPMAPNTGLTFILLGLGMVLISKQKTANEV